jgi:hypothetical protein
MKIKSLNTKEKKIQFWSLIIAGVSLYIFSSFVGYSKLYMTDERRLNNAFADAMTWSTFVKTTSTSAQDTSEETKVRIELAPKLLSQTINRTTMPREDKSQPPYELNIQSISDVDKVYTQYINLDLPPQDDATPAPDYSSVENRWSFQDSLAPDDESKKKQMAEPLVVFFPVGKVSRDQKNKTLENIITNAAYKIDKSLTTTEVVDGKKLRVLTIKTNPKLFVGILQQHIIDLGLGKIDDLDVDQFQGAADLTMKIYLNSSNTIVQTSLNGRTDKYTDQNTRPSITVPSTELTTEALQKEASDLQTKAVQ